MRTPWIPRAMQVAPQLDLDVRPGPPRVRSALLINPFYPKDPHASFGKHVPTPSLALPRHMTPEALEEGFSRCYHRLFSHRSIRRRRPDDWRAVPPYLAMSYLYKRSNRLWHSLIRHRLTGHVWRPLIEWTRWRHLQFRRGLASSSRGRFDGRRSRVGRGLIRASEPLSPSWPIPGTVMGDLDTELRLGRCGRGRGTDCRDGMTVARSRWANLGC